MVTVVQVKEVWYLNPFPPVVYHSILGCEMGPLKAKEIEPRIPKARYTTHDLLRVALVTLPLDLSP